MKTVRTLFPYVGGKSHLIKQWVDHFPPHVLYVSVFGGAGSDILHKKPSDVEVFNDVDEDIYNLFKILQHRKNELIHRINHTLSRSRQTYEEAVEILKSDYAEPLRRVWAFLVVAHQSIRRKHPALCTKSNYAVLKSDNRSIRQWRKLPETMEDVSNRFKEVQVEKLDFRKLIPKLDGPNTFFFCDPPYHPETRAANLYKHEMAEQDHADLLRLLNQVEGKAWLCGYEGDQYSAALDGWRKQTFKSHSPARTKEERIEVVWTNYVPVAPNP